MEKFEKHLTEVGSLFIPAQYLAAGDANLKIWLRYLIQGLQDFQWSITLSET